MFPSKEGRYSLVANEDTFGRDGLPDAIDVYDHPIRGLCVWTIDYGCTDPDFYDDGHVPIGDCGLPFGELLNV
jgi:hypothetical protein